MLFKLFIFFHPFFINVVDIHENKAEKSLEISVRIFTDDFEKTLRKNNPNAKVDLSRTDNAVAMGTLIKTYIPQHLNLFVNGKTVLLTYIGYEKNEESIWSYFEINGVENVKELKIVNTLLFDYSKDQINMHNITLAGIEQSEKLNYPKKDLTIKVN